MKTPLFVLLGFLFLSQNSWGQAVSLSPATRNPPNLTLATPAGAGVTPYIITSTATIISNTQQKVFYSGTSNWPSVYVSQISTNTPAWMDLTVTVPGGTFWQELFGGYGITQGTITIDNTDQAILTTIWQTSQTSRVITLNVNIPDFSQIVAGTYTYQLRYSIR